MVCVRVCVFSVYVMCMCEYARVCVCVCVNPPSPPMNKVLRHSLGFGPAVNTHIIHRKCVTRGYSSNLIGWNPVLLGNECQEAVHV